MNNAQRWKEVKAHIAAGDKAQDRADNHYKAAGLLLNALKAEHKGTWAEWEKLLKEKAGIGKSRASELMQIADGTKTAEQVRADTNKRKIKYRASPFWHGETKEEARIIVRDMGATYASPPAGVIAIDPVVKQVVPEYLTREELQEATSAAKRRMELEDLDGLIREVLKSMGKLEELGLDLARDEVMPPSGRAGLKALVEKALTALTALHKAL